MEVLFCLYLNFNLTCFKDANVYIKHIERFLNLHHHLQDKDNRFCPMCNGSVKLNDYAKHISLCYKIALDTTSDKTIIKLRKPGSSLKLKN